MITRDRILACGIPLCLCAKTPIIFMRQKGRLLCHLLVHVDLLIFVSSTLIYYREQMRLSDTYSGSIIHGFGVWFKQGEVRRLPEVFVCREEPLRI